MSSSSVHSSQHADSKRACDVQCEPVRDLRDAYAPGHRLLPMWDHLVSALPLIGEACVISRNQHVILGGLCTYPDVRRDDACADDQQFHPDYSAWREGWYYEEKVHDQEVSCVEFRDAQGLGFHKVIFTEQTDYKMAGTLVRAFEQEPLTQVDIDSATKANHLDGACCAVCEASLQTGTMTHAAELRQFIQSAISLEAPLRVVLHHAGLVSVRRFVPRRWKPNGLWQSIAGDGVSLFIRSTGIGSLEVNPVEFEDIGPSMLATLRDRHGNLMVSLVMEDLPS